jgi:hypothetical protein
MPLSFVVEDIGQASQNRASWFEPESVTQKLTPSLQTPAGLVFVPVWKFPRVYGSPTRIKEAQKAGSG